MAHAETGLPHAGVVTLRRPGTVSLVVLLAAGMLMLFGWILVNPGVDHSLAGRALGGCVFLTLTWLGWRVSVYPCLRITPTHLVIRNPVFCHLVPWRAVEAVEARDDLTVVLWDRREIRVWAFPDSLLTDFLGDRHLGRAATLTEAGHPRRAEAAAPVRRRRLLAVGRYLQC